MSRLLSLLAAIALAASLTACTSSDSDTATSEGTETTADAGTETTVADGTEDDAMAEDDTVSADDLPITGELSYDGVAVEAGSTLILTLTDITDANPETALVSEQTIEIEDGTSPITFAIEVPRADLDPELRYSLRAQIADASGTALLTTNSANFVEVDGDSADLGTLPLVSAA